MAGLELCSKHNMVAYLEKTDGNTEFHQIMDFLTRSSINYALTVSPIVSTLFVEQFWMTAKSRIVNNTSYIVIRSRSCKEASIRSDLLFNDADVIDSLNNQAIFDNIQLMSNQLKDVHVPLDHFPVPTLTKKVLKFMVKKGKNFSGKVTPLFDLMLVQQTEDEGEASERPYDSQPIPSPPYPSEDQPQTQTALSPRPSPSIVVPNPEGSGGNHGGQSSNDASLLGNANGLTLQRVKKLKKGVKPLITHHKAWMKTRLARNTSLKKKGVHKEYVSKQGRKSVKSFKGEPSVYKDPAFDDLDDIMDDSLDYMETEDAQDKGRISSVVLEEKENADKEVSTEAPISTVKKNKGTDKKNEGTDKQDGGTDITEVSTNRQGEGTADQNERKSATQTALTPTSTPTPTIFGDEEESKGSKEEKAQRLKKDIQATHKTKEQIRQEEAGLEEAISLQAQMDEEVAKQIHLDKITVEMINGKKKFYAEQKAKAKRLSFEEWKNELKVMKSIESFVPMETEARVKRHGLQLEQETSKKQKIDIEDASITKGKDEVVKEEEAEVNPQNWVASRNMFGRRYLIIHLHKVLVTPGSIVVTPGSVVVTPGSVITTGSILVSPGSVMFCRDRILDSKIGRKSTASDLMQ
ncbi:hypothetical protein Tco_0899807 [Tanacetum coccineum]